MLQQLSHGFCKPVAAPWNFSCNHIALSALFLHPPVETHQLVAIPTHYERFLVRGVTGIRVVHP